MAIILRRLKLGRTSGREIARLMAHPTTVVRNDRDAMPNNPDVVFRWGCTAAAPQGAMVVNKSSAIHLVNNKTGFRRILNEHNLSPRTWFSVEALQEAENVADGVIVRPRVHAQGKKLFLCTTPAELSRAIQECGDGYYISEYIKKTAEYRVFVAQGRAVWVAQKTPGNPDDIAWNVARGGRFDNVRFGDWPLRVVKSAIEGFNLSGLDFGGVDVMVDGDGNPYILEINSAPSQTSPYRQQCVAKVFDYIVANGVDAIPIIEERGGWKKFIHPAVSEEAIVRAA